MIIGHCQILDLRIIPNAQWHENCDYEYDCMFVYTKFLLTHICVWLNIFSLVCNKNLSLNILRSTEFNHDVDSKMY